MTDPILRLDGVNAGYDGNTVLRDLTLDVTEGGITSIIGRNGAGKTTTLRAVMGHITVSRGSVHFDGADITNESPESIFRRGCGLVPEHREIFPGLTTEENLRMGGTTTNDGVFTIEEAYEFFPRLEERREQLGRQLSGGEQQMLAIARTLMGDTKLVMLDEPTEGLAPQIVDTILDIIERLSEENLTVLLVEQNLQAVMRVGDHHHVLSDGEVIFQGSTADLEAADDIRKRYLSVV